MKLNRFKQLLESSMGNVKPLITEMESEVIVYVVLEDDRGEGPLVIGVYRSREDAEREVKKSYGRYWIVEEPLQ